MNPYDVGKLEPHKPRRRLTPMQWFGIVIAVLMILRVLGIT
jgi:hypothetical protein